MIKELSDAFARLVNSLSSKPLATIVAVFLVGVSYIAYRSYNALEEMIITPSEEAARFREQLESAQLVNQSIEQLRSDLKANNVVIRQFHNGKHDLTGIPFTEASSTFFTGEYDDPGDEAVSTMNISLRKMWKQIDRPECVVLYSPTDSSSRKYFKTYNLTKVVLCPLTNLLNYPVGTIAVGFSVSDTDDALAVNKTSAIAKRVTGYLSNGY